MKLASIFLTASAKYLRVYPKRELKVVKVIKVIKVVKES
jgi:hypothetical protein